MDRRSLDLITLYVVALAALGSAGAWLVLGSTVGTGAVTGAGLSLANWLALRWLLGRVIASGSRSKGGLMALLVIKMLVLVTVVGLLVLRAVVSPVGLAIGLSALVVGLFAGAMHSRSSMSVAGEEP